MFDNNGNFYNIEHFYNILERKNNILCEYIMIKKALKEYRNKFGCSFASSVHIKKDILFLFSDNSIKYPKNINSKFYYSIFVEKKFQRSIYEHKWQKTFELSEKTVWRNIYISKIKYMYEKNIAEFNYKLLNCILNNNLNVSKWNKDVSPLCEHCMIVEDIEHLLYNCKLCENIWKKISLYIGFKVTWKILVVGFHSEINIKTNRLNNLLSFICFTMYKYKMKCRLKKETMSMVSFQNKI